MMENEELKAAVLAKCGEVAPRRGNWKTISKKPLTMILREVLDSKEIQWGLEMFKDDAHVELAFTKDTPPDSFLWPLAAQILGIAGKPKRTPFVNIPADTRMIGGMPEHRPSNALLWEAYKAGNLQIAGTQPNDVIEYSLKPRFKEWLKTLPSDPLENDQAALASGKTE